MRKQVTTFLVSVEHDAIPGTMHTRESVTQCVQRGLDSMVSSYNPIISAVDTETYESSKEAHQIVYNTIIS